MHEFAATHSGSFKDVPANHWAKSVIDKAVKDGYVKGYVDGTFKPDAKVTRGEFLGILMRAASQAPTVAPDVFSDISSTYWARNDINRAVAAGFVNPKDYGAQFKPDTTLTRFELAKWLGNGLMSSNPTYKMAFKELDGTLVPFTEYFRNGFSKAQIPYVALARGTGIVTGLPDGSFGLNKPASRAEVLTMLYRYLEAEGRMADSYSDLDEMREVGLTGTNVLSFTPYAYQKNGRDFSDLVGKKIKLRNDVADFVFHRAIVIDIDPSRTKTSVYTNMFSEKTAKYERYRVLVEATITPKKEDVHSPQISQASIYPITSISPSLESTHLTKYGVKHFTPYNQAQIFKKGVPVKVWGVTAFDKPNAFGTVIDIGTTEGTLVTLYTQPQK